MSPLFEVIDAYSYSHIECNLIRILLKNIIGDGITQVINQHSGNLYCYLVEEEHSHKELLHLVIED